jgi:tetratricopeptide (TPR) repeat protein
MLLSSVTASEGDYAAAERLASEAVQTALYAGLDTVAADGLIEVAGSLLTTRPGDAEALLRRSQAMAEKLGARRIAARAATQLAALQLASSPETALATLQPALDFFKDHHYRRYELQALTIAGRAHQRLDNIAKAREFTAEALKGAELTRDEQQIATALVNMAGVAAVVGDLPQALSHRSRAEEIYRRKHDVRSLAFNLANRAELLILLGRSEEAEAALMEIQAGIRNKVGAFVDRARRLAYLRFLDAVVHHQHRTAFALAPALQMEAGGNESASALGELMLAYMTARQERGVTVPVRAPGTGPSSGALQRESIYWDALARLTAGKPQEALTAVPPAIEAATRLGNDELHWRLAAVGAAAARALGRSEQERALRAAAAASLGRLRTAWAAEAAPYEKRPDVTELKRLSGIQ